MSTTESMELGTENVMQRLLRTGELSDFRFLVEEGDETETFRCHKVLLCRASAVFEAMFLGGMQEQAEVSVTDISPQAFKIMLQHIYTDEVQFADLEMSLQVMMVANKYLVMPLVDKCVRYAIEKMQTGNVCKLLEMAMKLAENQELKEACLKMLQENTEEILCASSWLEAHVDCVRTLLQQDTLNVSEELALVTACERWARHQVATDDTLTLREVVAPILPHLRLRTLTAEQLGTVSQEDTIFTAEEIRQILRCIVKPELNKLPEGMCELTTSRFLPNHMDKMDIASILGYMSDKDTDCLLLTKSSAQDTVDFPPLVLRTVRCHVLVCGIRLDPALSEKIDILDKISSNKKYEENMTVQLIDKQTRACVASLHFKEKMTYDRDHKLLHFPQPYLMREGTRLELKVTYHTRVRGHRSLYVGNTDINDEPTDPGLYADNDAGALGLYIVTYKIVQ